MDVNVLVMEIILGGLLGMVGQGARVVVGLKKLNDEAAEKQKPFSDLFSTSTLVVSLLIGFVAGVLALIGTSGIDTELIDKNTMLAIIGAGYAGTDFIEGFMKKNLPTVPVPAKN